MLGDPEVEAAEYDGCCGRLLSKFPSGLAKPFTVFQSFGMPRCTAGLDVGLMAQVII